MPVETPTSIQIRVETWKKLQLLKVRPSETFDDVINRLIDAGRREGAADAAS